MQAILGHKWKVTVPVVPGGAWGTWGCELLQLGNHVLALCEQHNLHNTVFSKESIGKNHALHTLLTKLWSIFGAGWSMNSIP